MNLMPPSRPRFAARSLRFLALLGQLAAWQLISTGRQISAVDTKVLVEEVVTSYQPANNGAGPLWCYGAPLLVRHNDSVYVSTLETGPDVPPLCNTRWQVWRRTAPLPERTSPPPPADTSGGWELVSSETDFRQREPCPLVALPGSGLFLSTNASQEPPGKHYGRCLPAVVPFPGFKADRPGPAELPRWNVAPSFSDHSYRGFAADRERGELLLLNIDNATSAQHVSWRGADGAWHARGQIDFPIRAAYPQVVLRDGAAHVLAIGDIREPREEWRTLKRQKTGREWDYVFRRLFYTYRRNIDDATLNFAEPIEVASVEETAGHITNLDLYVDVLGRAHLLYLVRPQQYDFIRDAYFPGQPLTQRLEYTVITDGKVTHQRTLAETPVASDDRPQGLPIEPHYARFHASFQVLYVVLSGVGAEQDRRPPLANFLIPVDPPGRPVTLTLRFPFSTFFTNTTRGGSAPGPIIDLFGTAHDPANLRYAQIQLRHER
jgi:hypothetical protein